MMPREHGATAMLLIPAFCAAILAREWRWVELWTLVAAFAVFLAKDWIIVLARQRWVWGDPHPESVGARQVLIAIFVLFAISSHSVVLVWPVWALLTFGLGGASFMVLAVWLAVRNRQRSVWFQIASAMGLSSTSLAMCLSATGSVERWCWWLWLLCSLQATAGILVVHSRLEGRIAARRNLAVEGSRPAQVASAVLVCSALAALAAGSFWIAGGLGVAAAGYSWELRRQRDVAALQMPLTRVGLQALGLAVIYAGFVVVGLY